MILRKLTLLLFVTCILFCGKTESVFAIENHHEELFQIASERWEVPQPLLKAIAKNESSFHLWAVNIAGKSYYPESKDEALAIIKSAIANKKGYDIGIMQINKYWLKRFNLPPEIAIEPRNNILIGAWILAQEINRYGNSWKAIGSYHTSVENNEQRARQYAAKVLRSITSGDKR